MDLALYQVDAFAERAFAGNPAAVMPLVAWLDDDVLQALAAENNLSETAFFCPAAAGSGADYDLRWFTPKTEVDLCGHATLASAHVLFRELEFAGPVLRFGTASGILTVRREGERLVMEFPARPGVAVTPDPAVVAALGRAPEAAFQSRDLLLVYENAAAVAALVPDFAALARTDLFAVTATAPAEPDDEFAFVCRFFAPKVGVPEDPVTGSAFSTLIPYWAERLGRTEFAGRQISTRGGTVGCRLLPGDRVELLGHAVTFFKGVASI